MTDQDLPASRRGRWRQILAVLAVVALPFAVAGLLARRLPAEEGVASVTEANFRRLRPGMSRADVEGVLGPAPQNSARAYRFVYCDGKWTYQGAAGTYPCFSNEDLAGFRPVSPGGSVVVWPGQEPCAMVVEFDAGGKVYGVGFLECGARKPSPLGRVLGWLGM